MGRKAEFQAGHEEAGPQPVHLDEQTRGAFPKEGRRMGMVPDMGELAKSPMVQAMTERNMDMYHHAVKTGQLERGMRYYDDEKKAATEIGERFNAARQRTHRELYLPERPHLAGLLLQGQFSQNNTETGRKRLVESTASTGDIGKHLSTPKIQLAIAEHIHPLDPRISGRLKLRDYTGSQAEPEEWEGGHGGVNLGLGYTIDRHNHDLTVGRKYGNADRGISGALTIGEQRYRVMQAATHFAHREVAPKLSRPQFQAVVWGGWRGGYD